MFREIDDPSGKCIFEFPRSSTGSFPMFNPSLVVWIKTLNDWFIAPVSGAKTTVSICLSTATEINSVVEENFISIFLDNPFCSVLSTSTTYVP